MLLCIISVVNLIGIGGSDHSLVGRQIWLVIAGLAVLMLFASFNYHYLKNWSLPVLILYGGTMLILAATLLFPAIRNIRAWISFGGVQFEPSEAAKLALIILLAKYFSQRHIHIQQFRHIIVSGLYAGLLVFIVLMQPDLGSAAMLAMLWIVFLIAAGTSRKHLFLIASLGIVGAYCAWIWALAPYQKDRILAFINPYEDPSGYGYHIIQSQIAIGSAGWLGRGFGQGSQASLGFLPEPYNDFAFSAFTEQFGFVGAVILLGLILFVIWRILRTASAARNNFARLFCIGAASLIGAHTIVSAGVNIGLLPITGIPFSFLSYGGSHLIVLMAMLGVVQSIYRSDVSSHH